MSRLMLMVLLLCFGKICYAQINSGSVTLTIRLYPIQTLIINAAQSNVGLDYMTKGDYGSGVNSNNVDHLSIFSTGGFEVKVRSITNEIQQHTGMQLKAIEAGTIQVLPSEGSRALTDAQYTPQPLSANDQIIVSSNKASIDRNISIEYKGAGSNIYSSNAGNRFDPVYYTTNLIYTVLPK